jgi:hypothetical protein
MMLLAVRRWDILPLVRDRAISARRGKAAPVQPSMAMRVAAPEPKLTCIITMGRRGDATAEATARWISAQSRY